VKVDQIVNYDFKDLWIKSAQPVGFGNSSNTNHVCDFAP
jgi:hypothetical protein